MSADPKDRPSAEWIASMRERFPTEEYVDRALTGRLQRRGSPSYRAQSVAAIAEQLQRFL